ncbi:DUF1801 domain-containing protein [Actinomyces haliotis]|uniref:DUF1801 domain-containing protein n=1 Tax=Actinomyces haliotis TaxID=1280843 RepID=UPI00188F666F|nr:DUF1801 domain-containing protein [Actinomyces haliotis]
MERTSVPVDDFLTTVPERRAREAAEVIAMMREVTGADPVMWGPSIIGFGQQPYETDGGTTGIEPVAAFSPRKAALTVYLSPAVLADEYLTGRLGRHRAGKSCLYLTRLSNADPEVLRELVVRSVRGEDPESPRKGSLARVELRTVADYLASVPLAARPGVDRLRELVRDVAPEAEEVVSYGLIGYRMPGRSKAARVFVSGWKGHLGMYPLPKDTEENTQLRAELEPWVHGKGTLWLPLDGELPEDVLRRMVAVMTA